MKRRVASLAARDLEQSKFIHTAFRKFHEEFFFLHKNTTGRFKSLENKTTNFGLYILPEKKKTKPQLQSMYSKSTASAQERSVITKLTGTRKESSCIYHESFFPRL